MISSSDSVPIFVVEDHNDAIYPLTSLILGLHGNKRRAVTIYHLDAHSDMSLPLVSGAGKKGTNHGTWILSLNELTHGLIKALFWVRPQWSHGSHTWDPREECRTVTYGLCRKDGRFGPYTTDNTSQFYADSFDPEITPMFMHVRFESKINDPSERTLPGFDLGYGGAEDWILDIDLDFFGCNPEVETGYGVIQNHADVRNTICQLAQTLSDWREAKPLAVVISRSVESGYTPRHLADGWQSLLLQHLNRVIRREDYR